MYKLNRIEEKNRFEFRAAGGLIKMMLLIDVRYLGVIHPFQALFYEFAIRKYRHNFGTQSFYSLY